MSDIRTTDYASEYAFKRFDGPKYQKMNLRPLTAGRSFRPTYTWMENRFQSGRKGRRTNVSRESSYGSYDSSGYLGQEEYERSNSYGQKNNYLPVPSGRRREESVVNIGQNDYRLLDEGEYAVTPSEQYDYPVTGCQVGEYKSSNTMYTSNSKNPRIARNTGSSKHTVSTTVACLNLEDSYGYDTEVDIKPWLRESEKNNVDFREFLEKYEVK